MMVVAKKGRLVALGGSCTSEVFSARQTAANASTLLFSLAEPPTSRSF